MRRRITHVLVAGLTGLTALTGTAPAARAAEPIQPGALIEDPTGAALCTMGFVFRGLGANAGKTYVSTAAHCVDRIGEVLKDGSGTNFGTAVWIGNANDTGKDFAFLEVLPSELSRVVAQVKGIPGMPAGYTKAAETKTGKKVQVSGYGMGFEYVGAARENRKGVLVSDDATTYTLIGLDTFGDSGGPFVYLPTKQALGLVSRVCFGACTSEGPTVEGMIAQATAAGFPVALKTIYG